MKAWLSSLFITYALIITRNDVALRRNKNQCKLVRITCDCCTACEEGSVNKKKEIKSPRLKAQCNSGEGGESTAIPLQVLLPYSDLIAEDLLVATYALTQPQLSVCTAAAF